MRGQCIDMTLKGRSGNIRFAAVAVALLAGAGLSGCSTVQGWLSGSETVKAADAAPGANDPYPSLGSVPDRPTPTQTSEERKEVAKSLIADRDRIAYMDEQLRGGGEISAPPPPVPVGGAMADDTSANAMKAKAKTGGEGEAGFFTWLFGRKKPEPTPDTAGAVSAHPTAAVTVSPADDPTSMPQGPSAN